MGRIELYPSDTYIRPHIEKVKICDKNENAFIYYEKHGAKGVIPFYRFINKDDVSRVQIGSEVTIYYYFSGKRLVAYHAKYEQ